MKKYSFKYLLLLLLLFGCATQPMYYWGNYSSTLYHYKKNLTDEKLAEHKKSLSEIITKSNELELKPPPGVYADLGYIYYNAGDFIKAEEYISLEAKTYPESQYFMNQILLKINENK